MKKNSSVIWILKKIRRRIPAILIMTLAHIGQAVFGVLFALGTKNVIDAAASGMRGEFIRACFIQGGIILGTLFCLTLYRHLHDRLFCVLDRDWKTGLFNKLLHGDYPKVSEFHSAELLNRLNNDVRTIDEGLLSVFPNLAAMLTKLVSAAAVLISLESLFGGIILCGGAVVILLTAVIRKPLKALHKKVSEADGKVSAIIQESVEKLLMVQSMDVSGEIESRTGILLDERFSLQRKRKNLSLFANSGISVLSYAAGFGALVWCSFGILGGTMTFGSLTAITQLVSQLQTPFVGLSGVIPQYIAMTAAAERLMEIDSIEREQEPFSESPDDIYSDIDGISAEKLCFSYDREAVFENASFVLPKNSFAVITGASGIGKSTLLKLLLGIFCPEEGELFFSKGSEKLTIGRKTRKLFAYVPQGNLLLSGSLRDNLIITNPKATEEEIALAVRASAMDEFLSSLPDGLDTVLGESGAGLSEGQAQRLAIARAVLSGAPVLLLDECTSALDSETERTVLERLRALPGRTCIAVTHRPAAAEIADLIIRVENKKIFTENANC